jgi:hypothetical protein
MMSCVLPPHRDPATCTTHRAPSRRRAAQAGLAAALGIALAACTDDATGGGETAAGSATDTTTATTGATDTETDTETGEPPGPPTVAITHDFGTYTLAPYEEVEPCVSWTLNNDQPIYVSKVTLASLGTFHHSNWFFVPESDYAGPDGFWSCDDRNFEEIQSARRGGVLFAQSTQSWLEAQEFANGAVVKIPPRSKIVATTHLLNLAPREVQTQLWMSLDLLHPRDVTVLLSAFRLSYLDLGIPAMSRAHFNSDCSAMRERYEAGSGGQPFKLKIHWVLPHYHYLGEFFDLRVIGGALDGESIFQLSGFNADANGKLFDPPIDVSDADGLGFTCGYDNWRDREIVWGIGENEMCVMLGLAETDMLMDGTVLSGSTLMGEEEGVLQFEGSCFTLALSKPPNGGPPTDEEKAGEQYVPPTDPNDEGLPPVPECVDSNPAAQPLLPPTLADIRENIFVPACTFSACHDGRGLPAGGLNLEAADLHTELLTHETLGNPGMPLVDPGAPDNSWLYRVLSECGPQNDSGVTLAHMPRNAPVLLPDDVIAMVRVWIEQGALP